MSEVARLLQKTGSRSKPVAVQTVTSNKNRVPYFSRPLASFATGGLLRERHWSQRVEVEPISSLKIHQPSPWPLAPCTRATRAGQLLLGWTSLSPAAGCGGLVAGCDALAGGCVKVFVGRHGCRPWGARRCGRTSA